MLKTEAEQVSSSSKRFARAESRRPDESGNLASLSTPDHLVDFLTYISIVTMATTFGLDLVNQAPEVGICIAAPD